MKKGRFMIKKVVPVVLFDCHSNKAYARNLPLFCNRNGLQLSVDSVCTY